MNSLSVVKSWETLPRWLRGLVVVTCIIGLLKFLGSSSGDSYSTPQPSPALIEQSARPLQDIFPTGRTPPEQLRPLIPNQQAVTMRDDTYGCRVRKDLERLSGDCKQFKSGGRVMIREDLWSTKCVSNLDRLDVCYWVKTEAMCGVSDMAKDREGLYIVGKYIGICRQDDFD
jgi:hypothetical protein